MGEVYRARDPRLGRDVAIKILHPSIAIDADRLHRFEQEARAAAALNHPNILAVFDIGHVASAAGHTPYIVSELLEGRTLRDRLSDGAFPLRRATDLAIQIAKGLAAAHDKGIVHRDLKPENVIVTEDGRAKILDFGLAKLLGPAQAGPGASHASPTLLPTTPPLTQAGVVFGTVGYMSPEQVRGQSVDARTDIFAFGTILYELITGSRAFDKETAAETMTAILREDPPGLQADSTQIPPGLRRIIDRCLAKTPAARFKSADDLAFALDSVSDSAPSRPIESAAPAASLPPLQPSQKPNRLDEVEDAWRRIRKTRSEKPARARRTLLTRVAVVALIYVVWRVTPVLLRRLEPAPVPVAATRAVMRLELSPPDGVTLMPAQAPAVSADGSEIAFVGVDRTSGKRQIYLRRLDSAAAQPQANTEHAIYPFWASEGRRMAFFADGLLKTLDTATGTVRTVCRVEIPGGQGVWIDDEIYFPKAVGAVARVSAQGGAPVIAGPLDNGGQSVVGVFGDPRRVILNANAGILLASADGASARPIATGYLRAALYAPQPLTSGEGAQLIFVQAGKLVAQRFNTDALKIEGAPVVLAEPIGTPLVGSGLPFSVQSQVLAYVTNASLSSRLMWVDRNGQVLGQAASITGGLRDVRLSKDGTRAALVRVSAGGVPNELVVVDLSRNLTTRIAYEQNAVQPSWALGDTELIFVDTSLGTSSLDRVRVKEGAKAEKIWQAKDTASYQPQLAADGRTIVYARISAEGNFDIMAAPLADPAAGREFAATPAAEMAPRLSPDGRWIAYQSTETGQFEIFIRSFPGGADKRQASRGGGVRPVWRHDGGELFYVSPDGDIMAAIVTTTPNLATGSPVKLFRAPLDPSVGVLTPFDVHPDGKRFLVQMPVTEVQPPINIILNWQELLRK